MVRSQRPIPVVQIVGYRLLGVALIFCGVALFAAVLHTLSGSYRDVAEVLALMFGGAMSTAFFWYGWYLIKRGAQDKR
jgi:Ni,Fe-hydrogenase I cytochrome b subunit